MSDKLDELLLWQRYADLLIGALVQSGGRYPLYIQLGWVKSPHDVWGIGGWCGLDPCGAHPPTNAEAPAVAHAKMGELVLANGGRGGIVITPTAMRRSLGFRGGVARDGWAIAASKWAQDHDQLMAATLLDMMLIHNFVRVHHVGRTLTVAEFEAELVDSQQHPGITTPWVEVPAPDHVRAYRRATGLPGSLQEKPWYEEIQVVPGARPGKVHLDLVVQLPHNFLQRIAYMVGEDPTWFHTTDPKDPVGVIWVQGADGTWLGLMARGEDWEIPGIA